MAWHDRAPNLFPHAVLTEYVDRQKGLYRAAAFIDGRLEGALFVDRPTRRRMGRSPPDGWRPRHRRIRHCHLRLLRRRPSRNP
jgi:hypothetical protein